jgi:hypothetical protein
MGVNDEDVVSFPRPFEHTDIIAQKRLAQQLVAQMMVDPREQRAVLKYMEELISWQEQENGSPSPHQADEDKA